VKTILSLSGGGIRGLLSAIWLDELEVRLGRPLRDVVAVWAGTSTGAIQACCLASGRFMADELVGFYREHGAGIFQRNWLTPVRYLLGAKYPHAYLEQQLRKYLHDGRGRLLTLDEGTAPVLCEAFDVNVKRPVTLSSWDFPSMTMLDAARASSAAPTYFRPHLVSYRGNGQKNALIDGGLECNHPGADAYAWLRQKEPGATDIAVVSIGTGKRTRVLSNQRALRMTLLGWAKESLAIAMHTERTSNMLAAALQQRYAEIDCELVDGASDDMDDASPKNLEALEHLARAHVARHPAQFDRAVEILKKGMA
jgi:patatin-like phospholipase/acyl hydrolase